MYLIFLFIYLLASSLTPPRSDSASIASKAKESSDTSDSDEDMDGEEDDEVKIILTQDIYTFSTVHWFFTVFKAELLREGIIFLIHLFARAILK